MKLKMLGRAVSAVATMGLGAALVVGLVGGGTASPPPAGGEAVEQSSTPPGIGINGHYVNSVLLNGKMMSLPEYGLLERQANETGSQLSLMVDTSAITRGYLVAFTDESQVQAYLDKTSRPRSAKTFDRPRLPMSQRVVSVGEGASLLGTDRIGLMSCASVTQPTHQAYLYEDTACGGSHFVALWKETEKNLGTYGWSNRISSMIIGDCIANMRVWDPTGAGDNGGANRNFGNSSAHTTYSSIQFGGSENWCDRISSYKTDLSAGSACA